MLADRRCNNRRRGLSWLILLLDRPQGLRFELIPRFEFDTDDFARMPGFDLLRPSIIDSIIALALPLF